MLKDIYFITPIIISIFFTLLAVILGLIHFIPLYELDSIIRFDSLRGVSAFGGPLRLTSFLLISISYLAIDIFLANRFYKTYPLYSYLLLFSGSLLSLLLLIFINVIIKLN